MATAQPGIFAQGTRSHFHLEFDVRRRVGARAIAEAVTRLREPAVTSGGFNIVVGLGAALSRRLAPTATPPALRPFDPINGAGGRRAPATQHDIWVWLHGTGPDVALDGARAVAALMHPVASLAAEQACFVYRDSRDLTGFIDGTENPPVEEAPGVALVPDGQPGAGGAFAVTMRWVHNLAAFDALPVIEQQGVFGRTKPDSVELRPKVKPLTAHIARVVVEENGSELEIYRRSVPYGSVAEHGLYFVAFSAELRRFDVMLSRMYGTFGDGLHDRLTDFTTPVSGAYYFVPSLEALASL